MSPCFCSNRSQIYRPNSNRSHFYLRSGDLPAFFGRLIAKTRSNCLLKSNCQKTSFDLANTFFAIAVPYQTTQERPGIGVSFAELYSHQPITFPNQVPFDREQISNDPLGSIIGKWASRQCTMSKIGQQVMGHIGQQDQRFLSQETMLAPGGEMQALLVVAKLLDFCAAALVVQGHGDMQGVEFDGCQVVAVLELSMLHAPLDPHEYLTPEIDRRSDCS